MTRNATKNIKLENLPASEVLAENETLEVVKAYPKRRSLEDRIAAAQERNSNKVIAALESATVERDRWVGACKELIRDRFLKQAQNYDAFIYELNELDLVLRSDNPVEIKGEIVTRDDGSIVYGKQPVGDELDAAKRYYLEALNGSPAQVDKLANIHKLRQKTRLNESGTFTERQEAQTDQYRDDSPGYAPKDNERSEEEIDLRRFVKKHFPLMRRGTRKETGKVINDAFYAKAISFAELEAMHLKADSVFNTVGLWEELKELYQAEREF